MQWCYWLFQFVRQEQIPPEFTGGEMDKHRREEETGTLLYYASKGNVPILKYMLDNGTSVDAADYDGRTALHLAASEGHAAAVTLLLDYNPNVNPCDRFNETVSEFMCTAVPCTFIGTWLYLQLFYCERGFRTLLVICRMCTWFQLLYVHGWNFDDQSHPWCSMSIYLLIVMNSCSH